MLHRQTPVEAPAVSLVLLLSSILNILTEDLYFFQIGLNSIIISTTCYQSICVSALEVHRVGVGSNPQVSWVSCRVMSVP